VGDVRGLFQAEFDPSTNAIHLDKDLTTLQWPFPWKTIKFTGRPLVQPPVSVVRTHKRDEL